MNFEFINLCKALDSNFFTTLLGVFVGGVITIGINQLANKETTRLQLQVDLWGKVSSLLNDADEMIVILQSSLKCDKLDLKVHILLCKKLTDKLVELYSKINSLINNYLFLYPELMGTMGNLRKMFIEAENLSVESTDDIYQYLEDVRNAFICVQVQLQKYLLKGVYSKKNYNKILKAGKKATDEESASK